MSALPQESAPDIVPNAPPAASNRRALIALVMVNALWGTSFPVMKCLNYQVDRYFGEDLLNSSVALRAASASWMIGIRFGLALLLLLLLTPRTLRRVGRPQAIGGLAIGGLFFSGLILQVIGLASIDASRSSFLTSLAVVFTPIAATIFAGRAPRRVVLAGVFLALVGVAVLTEMLIIGGPTGPLRLAPDALQRWSIGDSLTTLGAVFFSCQILFVDYWGKRYDSAGFTPTMFAATAGLAMLSFFVLGHFTDEAIALNRWVGLASDPSFALMLLFLSVFASWLAFSWMNTYQPRVSAVQAAVIYTLEPVCASLWAMILPGMFSYLIAVIYANEKLTASMLIGGALILAANVLALWPPRRSNAKQTRSGTQIEPEQPC